MNAASSSHTLPLDTIHDSSVHVRGPHRRLAPIRGIPTKEGEMMGPNSDLSQIFSNLEELPQKPARLISGFLSWARGEQDPDWGDKKQRPRRR